jgi:subfamily B ATP-binding cassette protein MsbA
MAVRGYLYGLLFRYIMKDIYIILRRFALPYKQKLILNFLFNLLSAAFTVFSMGLMIPILKILFNQQTDVTDLWAWKIDIDTLEHNLYYYITQVKSAYGVGWTLLFVGAFIVITTAFKTGFAYLASYTIVGVRNKVVRDIRSNIYSKILKLQLAFYSEERKGDIMSRVMGDVQEVENSIMSSLSMILKNPVTIIVLLGSMMFMSFKLTLFVLIVLPFAGGLIGRIGRSLKKSSKKGQEKMGDIVGVLEETLSGLRIIKAFNAESKMGHRFGKQLEDYRRISNTIMRRRDLAHPVSELLGTVIIVMVVWFGGTLILNNTSDLSGASFIAFIGIFYQIIQPAKDFSNAYFVVQRGIAAIERIDKVLGAEITIEDRPDAIEKKDFKTGIEYRNVSFSYSEKQVLKNVSVSIPKGKTVALVGQSGSGKTTFVDLLPRFYDVNQGGIYIDGQNIKDLKIADLRGLMGNVNQEAILFNDSIYNNITFGVDHEVSMAEVIEAAKVANAHDFIIETEHGYDTVIGDRGSKLSGGQRQRLSIARAILKNPPVLILDEATSALDTESERLVQDALERLMAHRTSVVIAHRLSTVRNADMICVFQEGEIVERGTHQELLANNSIYKKLHSLQMRD